jgi:hypothetical protein
VPYREVMAGTLVPPSARAHSETARARILYTAVIGSLVVALVALDISQAIHTSFGWDFRAFYDGGRDYLHLRSPYVSGSLADLTSRQNFVYPLPAAALFAPVSLLPYHLAAVLFVTLSVVLLLSALWLMGVRDPRCYAAMLISAPVLDAFEIGTVSPILAFLVAVIWRYRDRTWIVACALSVAVLLKLFLWPLAIWLLATRRIRGLVGAVAISAVALIVSALPLGIDALRHYPDLLRTVSKFEAPSSLSLVGLGTSFTGSIRFGTFMSLVCGIALLAEAGRCARRGNESLAFRLTIVAALALTPIVWNHYLVVLFVAIAMTHPRFSPVWLGTAWVLGAVHGDALGGVMLALALVAVWAVVLAQAGLVSLAGGVISVRLSRLAGVIALWVALIASLVALVRVVPAVAALRGSGSASTPSGTANLRLFHNGSVCMTVLTSGVKSGARLQLVDMKRMTVLVGHKLTGDRTSVCRRHSHSSEPGDLADAFKKKRLRLALRVVAQSGRLLLSGLVVSPSDAR